MRMSHWLDFARLGCSNQQSQKGAKRRDLLVALVIATSAFLIYTANMRAISPGDAYAARYLPLSIWRHQSLHLDPVVELTAQGRRLPDKPHETTEAYWIIKGPDGHFAPRYPILLPLAVTPLYAPAAAYLHAHDWDPRLVDETARLMEKFCASLLAALSVALLYALLRRRLTERDAAILSLIYAFCTTTWMISSQAFWTHGLAQVLIILALLTLTRPATTLRVGVAGLLCGLIAANRQPDAVLAAGMGVYALWWGRRHALLLIAMALIPGALALGYNLAFVGSFMGGYGLNPRPENFNDNLIEGVAGLLFSPTHGLFIFSPFLLFLLWRFPTTLRAPGARALTTLQTKSSSLTRARRIERSKSRGRQAHVCSSTLGKTTSPRPGTWRSSTPAATGCFISTRTSASARLTWSISVRPCQTHRFFVRRSASIHGQAAPPIVNTAFSDAGPTFGFKASCMKAS